MKNFYFILLFFILIIFFNLYFFNYSKSIWIIHDFFPKKDFNNIQNYCSKLNLKNDQRNKNRLSLCLDFNIHKHLYNKIYKNKTFQQFIHKIKNNNHIIKYNPSFPIEYRKYFNGSNGMEWHKDTSLFEPDGFEIVLTLTNNSDSFFQYIENNRLYTIYPKPNTLVIVKPNNIYHRVTKINNGERTFLKFIVEFIKKNKSNNIKKPEFINELNNCPF